MSLQSQSGLCNLALEKGLKARDNEGKQTRDHPHHLVMRENLVTGEVLSTYPARIRSVYLRPKNPSLDALDFYMPMAHRDEAL